MDSSATPAGERYADLHDIVHEGLYPLAIGVGVISLAHAAGHVTLLPREVGAPLATAAIAAAAVAFAVAYAVRRHRIDPRWAHATSALLGVLLLGTAVSHLALADDPRQTTNLILVVIGAGMFFLSWRWFAALASLAWIGWAAVAWTTTMPGEWTHFGFALAGATVLAMTVHGARLRANRRIEVLRLAQAERNRELQESARAQRESEDRYRDLVENGLGLVGMHDLDGVILSVNAPVAHGLGYREEELRGRNLRELVAAGWSDLVDEYLRHIVTEGRAEGVVRLRTRGGDERLWGYRNALRGGDAGPKYVVAHFYDVTERVHLEERLRTASAELERRVQERTADLIEANRALREEIEQRKAVSDRLVRYARAIETCHDGIAIMDLDARLLDANPALVAMCGARDKTELIGKTAFELIAPEDREQARQHARDAAQRRPAGAREYQLPITTTARLSIEANAAVIADDDGTAVGLVAVARDVTERRRIESELRHNEAFFRALMESSGNEVLVLDEAGAIIARPDPAPGAIGLFGHRQADIVGRVALEFVHPEDAVRVADRVTRVVRRDGATWKGELRIRRADGSWSTAEVSLRNLVHDPAVGGLVCTVHDVSARKAVEEELRRAKEAAEAASHAKGEFLATISHELRSPLHAIIGYADLLHEDAFGPLAPEQEGAVERIRKSAHGQLELVSAILDLSAMEASRLNVDLAPVSIGALLAELESESRDARAARPIEVRWECDAELPHVVADAAKLKIVIRNLVGNAIKFTEQGSVRISARRLGDGFEIAVADTGIGIPPDALDLIFEPFRQVDGSESRRYEGTGLGLHIVKRLLELLGGTISVASDVGRGSVFRVSLPSGAGEVADGPGEGDRDAERGQAGAQERAAPDVAVAADPSPPGEPPPTVPRVEGRPARRQLRVLVVDDLAVNQQILTTVLRRLGTAVDVASNGHEAVDAAERTAYDLILMDLQMPELDGMGATAEIRRREPAGRRVPIVALTANTVAGTRERCLAAGMDDYLAKPVRPADLRLAIERWAAPAADSAAA